MANTGRQYPFTRTHSTSVKFDQPLGYVPEYTITGALTLAVDDTDAEVGYGEMRRYVADGSHTPDFSAFAAEGPGAWVNTAGTVNKCFFYYDGSQYCVIITQPGTGGTGGGGGGDTTPPTMVSATATDATTVRVVFSESVTPTTTGWSIYKTEIAETSGATAVTGSGTTWDFTIADTAMTSSMTLKISYNATTGNTLDAAGNELATISLASVTNSIAGEDAYTTAWADASGISAGSYRSAVDTFIAALRTAGILTTHFDFLHILCGGSEAAVKLNIIDPTDADGSYRLTFLNTPTFAATGVTFNGTNQYINSHWIGGASTRATDNDYHIAAYHRTSAGMAGMTFGVKQNANGADIWLNARYTDDLLYAAQNNRGQNTVSNTDGKGFYLLENTGATTNSKKVYKDATLLIDGDDNGNGNTLPDNYPMTFAAYNDNTTISTYRACELSIISGGKSFNSTQYTAYKNAVAALATSLGL